jgi:bacterial surface protein 26-residue repeat
MNSDLGNWDVTNVKDVSEMFRGAESFNGNVSNWNTGNVTNMGGMFDGAQNFNQNISEWNVSAVTQFDLEENGQVVAGFLGNTAMSTENVDALLVSMSQQSLQPTVTTITTYPAQFSETGAAALNQLATEKA